MTRRSAGAPSAPQTPQAPYRVMLVKRGDVLTPEQVRALRDPEKLVRTRHCVRNGDGKLEARRDFQLAMPESAT
jgi:hypothetical protein